MADRDSKKLISGGQVAVDGEELVAIDVAVLPSRGAWSSLFRLNQLLFQIEVDQDTQEAMGADTANAVECTSFAFDETNRLPHVTLIQMYVRSSQVPQLTHLLQRKLQHLLKLPFSMPSSGVTYNSLNDLIVPCLSFDALPSSSATSSSVLHELHTSLVDLVKPFAVPVDFSTPSSCQDYSVCFYENSPYTSSSLSPIATSTSTSTSASISSSASTSVQPGHVVSCHINLSSQKYVSNFLRDQSLKKFWPHLTLGISNDKGVQLFKQELSSLESSLSKLEFDELGVYQLGNFCTCRKPIWTFQTHPHNA